ncbi:hypothetical protein JCM31185_10480 [Furfurilactobacillus curtus]|uniref:Uncharacterized protein n=1 Tax=Furfurilactobacillus curtus TaxID=1746200 RepID=A0ABQ5JP33_9LACO
MSYKHEAQTAADLVLLPSGPDTIREGDLASWPFGNYIYYLTHPKIATTLSENIPIKINVVAA